ncbi:NADPH:quinone oxidoreductase family protein [Chelatococcus sp. HY11]|uniref:NADPH:quinone oxidoreductase family protein n=2 Tax=unclassified Chelatococcus TaxID=2638111 RepID=UPI001BD02E33|nr:NADPH:quinone oxidoreductase family protein [Chelatococcus sp. HY11]MBS7742693.1 NADPH:quinone oxidoreductase family protein [Chelatococcus sp. HY11]CAH1655115.1 NADPH:quinone reductase-like Zn-dependent oxidoreductase [Hyphomicrobiales bacterium]CAH1695270.1 NADPH:quinone reductase-like Zn-dependent oxidoreductase [Hyphomicrobiales bacterium]
MMKAWVLRRFSKPFELEMTELPQPVPGPGEILIRNHAAGLAYGETLIFDGTYQQIPPLPYIPSNESAGVVHSCGEGVTKFVPGDRVMVFAVDMRGGALAEYSVMPQAFVFPCPERLSFSDAATSVMNYWTSFNALVRRGYLKAGETLVVHGATGGVGSTAVEIGKQLGARVIATGGSDVRLADVEGADHVINYNTEPLRDRVLELTRGIGADVYYDPVGGDLFDLSMRAIAPGGRILVVGFTSGRPALARTNVMLVKMVSVIGVEARLGLLRGHDEGWADLREMLDWIHTGRLNPRAGEVFAFEDAAKGYHHILSRQHRGKCVVEIP